MLTKLQAYSSWLSAPELTLDDSGREETDLIQIRGITGLDPVKGTVNTAPFGSVDGAAYLGTSVLTRNIVLTLHPNPDWDRWSNEALRRLLYSYFMTKLQTRLVFYSDDMPPVEIYGYVEDTNVNQFAQDLEMQVSIICPDPYFTAIDPTIVTGVSNQAATPVHYNGSIEAGINVEVTREADPAAHLVRVGVGDYTTNFFEAPPTVDSSNYYILNTIPGQRFTKNVNLVSGVATNLLSKVTVGSQWLTLQPGENDFTVVTDQPGKQDWQLTYYERYGGL